MSEKPKTCPNCHYECRTLVKEWREFLLLQPMCPLCANTAVLAKLHAPAA